MSSVLDKVWVESFMPREYEYIHHGVTQFGLLMMDIDKHWQSWRGQIFLCNFSTIPGNDARKLLNECVEGIIWLLVIYKPN